jgi:hypothetical protein
LHQANPTNKAVTKARFLDLRAKPREFLKSLSEKNSTEAGFSHLEKNLVKSVDTFYQHSLY